MRSNDCSTGSGARASASDSTISTLLADRGFSTIDADSVTTGKDFLLKIWRLVLSVPLGVAVIQEGIPARTLANIFYELGWSQANGKVTIVVRVGDAGLPSDFVRTEYVSYDAQFEQRFSSFLAARRRRPRTGERMGLTPTQLDCILEPSGSTWGCDDDQGAGSRQGHGR